jgi:anti-sigma B factor antagonist
MAAPVQPLADRRRTSLPTDFQVTLRRAGRIALVVVEGACDLGRADEFRAALETALDSDIDGLIVDLRAAEVFDSASLGAMTLAWKKAQLLGRPVYTVASTSAVLRPFEVAGLDRILMVVPTVGDAFAALRNEAA